jgi:serine/threonine-protein phosphatase 2A activator
MELVGLIILVHCLIYWHLLDSFTGHEMAFAAFLCCLYKIGALKEEDAVATVNRLFARYFCLEVQCSACKTFQDICK